MQLCLEKSSSNDAVYQFNMSQFWLRSYLLNCQSFLISPSFTVCENGNDQKIIALIVCCILYSEVLLTQCHFIACKMTFETKKTLTNGYFMCKAKEHSDTHTLECMKMIIHLLIILTVEMELKKKQKKKKKQFTHQIFVCSFRVAGVY